MPILASLNAKNRSKSPFSIGLVFSIVSASTVRRREPMVDLQQVTLIIDETTFNTISTSYTYYYYYTMLNT